MSKLSPVSDFTYQLRIANNWHAAIGFSATELSKRLANILTPLLHPPFTVVCQPTGLKRQTNRLKIEQLRNLGSRFANKHCKPTKQI